MSTKKFLIEEYEPSSCYRCDFLKRIYSASSDTQECFLLYLLTGNTTNIQVSEYERADGCPFDNEDMIYKEKDDDNNE